MHVDDLIRCKMVSGEHKLPRKRQPISSLSALPFSVYWVYPLITLTFNAKLSEKPFLWKWVVFAREQNNSFRINGFALSASLWNRFSGISEKAHYFLCRWTIESLRVFLNDSDKFMDHLRNLIWNILLVQWNKEKTHSLFETYLHKQSWTEKYRFWLTDRTVIISRIACWPNFCRAFFIKSLLATSA